jgi:adenylate kinase family enzyme
MKPVVIYVSGAPGSGKTTLAKRISEQLNIPQLSSDLIHGGVALTRPDHDRPETIRDTFVPYMIDTSKRGISFVVDHVLQKNIAKETIIDKLQEYATVMYIHTQAIDPISRYKQRIETHESADVHDRREYLLERADYHASNLDNTSQKIELNVPTLVVNTDNGYVPELSEVISFVKFHTGPAN